MARGEGGRGWSQETQVQDTCARKKKGRKPGLDKGQSETVWREERSLEAGVDWKPLIPSSAQESRPPPRQGCRSQNVTSASGQLQVGGWASTHSFHGQREQAAHPEGTLISEQCGFTPFSHRALSS